MNRKKVVKYVSCILLSMLMLFGLFKPASVEALDVITNPVDTQAPTVPTMFKVVEKTATTVTFSWQAATDNVRVTQYDLYSGTSVVATTAGTTMTGVNVFKLSGIASNTTYKFTIKARDRAGNVSAASNELLVTTNALVAPTNLKALTVTDTSVTLAWTSPAANGVRTAYNIYKGTTLVGTTTGITSFKVTGLTKNTAYNFTVRARDVDGKLSPASSILPVITKIPDTQAPTVPTGLTATAKTDTTVSLKWTASTDNVAVTGYNIYNGTTLVGTTTTLTTFIVRNLTANTLYKFTVKAKDAAGNVSAASNILSVTTNLPDTQAPTVPTGLTLTAKTDTTVTLKWTASTDNVRVTAYNIYNGTALVGTTSSTTFTVKGLTANTLYKFTVKARDAAGNVSAASNILSVTTNLPDKQAPTAPTGLTSTAKTDTTVTLKWTAATDNVKVTSYNIYNGTTLVGTTSSTTFIVKGLTANTLYKFTVKAKDAAGNVSAASNILSVTTNLPDTQAPTAPTGLTATTITETSITLRWTASTDNVKVTGYNIYVGTTLVGTTSSTAFTVNGLSSSTKYSITVRAKDAAGNLSLPSTTYNK